MKFPGPRSFLRAIERYTEQNDKTRLWITRPAQASLGYLYHSARTTYNVLAKILDSDIAILAPFVSYMHCGHILRSPRTITLFPTNPMMLMSVIQEEIVFVCERPRLHPFCKCTVYHGIPLCTLWQGSRDLHYCASPNFHYRAFSSLLCQASHFHCHGSSNPHYGAFNPHYDSSNPHYAS
jgi:hypothetical protein